MEPITLAQALAGKTVLVELLADRDYKDDCQAHTGIAWHGKGDRQRYPAQLWHKLAAHPTVWALVPEDDEAPPSQTPEQISREHAIAEADRVRQLSEEKAGQSSVPPGDGTQAATLADGQLPPPPPAPFDYSQLTKEVQDAMSVDQLRELVIHLGYGEKGTDETPVHPRLGEPKLRPLVAEITAKRLAAQQAAIAANTAPD
jgi:hypothetical protein